MNHHGKALIYWEENILIIKAKGPFNEEGMLDVFYEIKKSVLTKKNIHTWHKLSICDKETLGSISTIEILEKINIWCLANGCQKMATVICNNLQKFIIKTQISGQIKLFTCELEAKKWLS